MPTLEELAKEYADQLKRQKLVPTAPIDVANKIKDLRYTKSNEPLSNADKEKLLTEITQHLSHKKPAAGGGMITEAEDSTKFIEMVNAIRKEIKK